MTDKNTKIKQSLVETFKKRSTQICQSYKVKIQFNKLNNEQKESLEMLFVEAKWFYNHCLAWSKEEDNSIFKLNSTNVKTVKHFDKDKNEIISNLKYLGSSMKASIIKTMCSNIKTINTLIKKGYQKHSQYLKFKSEFTSIHLKQYGITHKITDKNHIKIQGIKKPLQVKGLDQIDLEYCEVATMNLLKQPDGYYLSIVTYTDKSKIQNPKPKNDIIAIDFGCETSFTFSNETKVDFEIKETERVKKLQKKLSRQTKGSNNYRRTKYQLKKAYSYISNCKDDQANKLVHDLKQEYNTIVIQDEQLSNWKQTGHGKAVQHSILGRVKAKLKNLPQTVLLDKLIPTTKFCPNCGKWNKLTEKDRIYKCSCGVEMDRDIHAAQNMVWIYLLIKELNLKNNVPMERREITRAEFLTAVKTVFNYSGDKLVSISNEIEDSNYDVRQIIKDKCYDAMFKLFETMKHEGAHEDTQSSVEY